MAMPQPGDLLTAFCPRAGTCHKVIYSPQLQATHCRQAPAWKGIWRDVKGRSWYVETGAQHAPKLSQDSLSLYEA
jgi:hypothetical protein